MCYVDVGLAVPSDAMAVRTPGPTPTKHRAMPTRKAKPERDVTKAYPLSQIADKLRRLADAVEGGERFRIQVAGERVSIPPDAMISVEHERGEDGEEVECQITWKSPVLPESGEKAAAKGKTKAGGGAKARTKEG